MSPAILIGEDCHYCTLFRNPHEILHQPGGVKICLDCENRHNEAMLALSTGIFTGQCSECGKTAEQLRSPDGRMAMHYENGKYRAMCTACDMVYVPKRRDLYGKTEFGHALGLGKC